MKTRTFRGSHIVGAVTAIFLIAVTQGFSNVEEWTGIGSDYQWSTNANWNGAFGIQANDDLVFPEEHCSFGYYNCFFVFRRAPNVNDLAVNTNFNSIKFTGGRYRISGNQIFLTNGFVANAYDNIFKPNVILGNSQIWTGFGDLTLTGVINLYGRTLTLKGQQTTFNGPIHGTGGGKINIDAGNTFLNGDTEYASFTVIRGGTLTVNGNLGGPIFMSGGTLKGVGLINANSNNSFSFLDAGTISPGDGVGSVGTLSIIGETQLNRDLGPVLEVDLDETVSGAISDRLRVTNGNFQINGTDLQVFFEDPPAAGKSFVILQQSGTGSITGQFQQGTAFVKDNQLFFISYFPDRVVLTAQGFVGP